MLNKVEICGVNTAKLPVLSAEETKQLFLKMQQGDSSAREKLISGNLRLVLSVLQRFHHRGENADDLFQVGCIGLIKAIDNFDLSQEVRLSTYAVPMILGEVRRYLRDNNQIRVSRSLRDIAYRAMQAREALVNELGREPKLEEIAKKIDIPETDVLFAMDAVSDPVSLYEPLYNDNGDPVFVMDQIRDEKNTDKMWTEQFNIKEGLSKLGEREKRIINLRFFLGKTQMEVAEEIGISPYERKFSFLRAMSGHRGTYSMTFTCRFYWQC